MAVAHDAATESDEWTGTTPDSQTHTPVGTPRGVVMFPICVTSTDSITAAAYGAAAPTEVPDSIAIDASSELGIVKAYFLGSSVPTGAQTCTLTQSGGNGVTRRFYVATVTAADDTEVVQVELIQDNTADPTVVIDTGSRTAITYVAMFSGLPSANVSAGSGLTALFERAVGSDARTFHLFRETTPASGSRSLTVNTSASADDCALTAVAISEVVAAGGGGTVAPASFASLVNLRSLVG